MSTRSFRCPFKILTGRGCLNGVTDEARRMGVHRALVVTSPQVRDAGHAGRLADLLRGAGIEASLFSGVDDEPTTDHVERGVAAFEAHGADGVVSIGGGSCLDAGKGVAVMARNEGPLARYEGYDKIERPRAPHIAVTTTAGTGSEVTRFAVFTDVARDVKFLSASDQYVPDVAIVDPDLTVSAPPPVTASAGIDALTHAIEAYVSRHAQPLTDALALSAIRLIAWALPRAYDAGADVEARTAMHDASLHAGLAFSNSSVALVHGLARPLGAVFHIPHGAANGTLLPHVMAFSLPAAPERYAVIADALGCESVGPSIEARARAGAEAVAGLCRRVGLRGLSAFGVTRDALAKAAKKMASDAVASGSPANNPRAATIDEMVGLYERAL